MKIIFGYQESGKFLIATVSDDYASADAEQVKKSIDQVSLEGEGYIEVDRKHSLKIAKLMEYGRKGDIHVIETE